MLKNSEGTIIGRLAFGQEGPQIRTTKTDKQVLNFSVAEDRDRKKDEAWETYTVWHNFSAWNGYANHLAKIPVGSTIRVAYTVIYEKIPHADGFSQTVPVLKFDDFRVLNFNKAKTAQDAPESQINPEADPEPDFGSEAIC